MESEKTKLDNLLATFKDIEKKLEIGKNTTNLIKQLLLIPIFNNALNKKFSKKEMDDLKTGKANRALIITAKTTLLAISQKAIADIELSLYQKTNDHEVFEGDRLNSLIGDVDNISPDKSSPRSSEADAIKASDFYSSFFSYSAMEQLLEFIKTGRMPPTYKKYLSVSFIDIVGFSTMAEYFPSEKVVSFLNFFFNQVQGTIEKYGGDIDKFIGDALLVIFNSAESAVRCSLEILLKDIDIVNFKLQSMEMTEIKIHCGINTGWVVQGYIGSNKRRETTVIGDGVNTASRIQSMSPPNKIYITSTTFVSLGKIKELFEPIGRKKLRGKVQEIMVYEYVKKVPSNHLVVLYEHDSSIANSIEDEMSGIGIKNLTKCNTYNKFETMVSPGKNKILVTGPSIDLVELEKTYKMVNEKCEQKLPIIPIIRKKLDTNAYSILEKMGFHTIIPLYIEGSMEKVNDVLVTENVKDIPRREIEPKPTVAPNESQDSKTTESEHNKITISATSDKVNLNINSILKESEKEILKKDIEKLWEYSHHKNKLVFVLTISVTDKDKLNDFFFHDTLSLFSFISNPEDVKLKIDFIDLPPDNWEDIKSNFKYQFI